MSRERRRAPRALCGVAAFALAFASASAIAQSLQPRDDAGSGLVAQAIAHEHGEGVPKDARRAAELYCEAARMGSADALFGLGWMYANGRGVGRDDAVAGALFAQAAAAGLSQAQQLQRLVRAERAALPECLMQSAADASMVVDPDTGTIALPDAEEDDPFANLPPMKRKIADIVTRAAPRFSVDPRLALAVVAAESNFDPDARSNKDARGLMQLIPETAARFNVRNAYNPAENLRGGLTYLRWLLAYYQGEVSLAVAAYNAGERAVDRYRGIPPYPETREYVGKVLGWFRRERHPYDPSVVDPSPIVATAPRQR
jgi:soluble lytic murein transglycosylase-like protein